MYTTKVKAVFSVTDYVAIVKKIKIPLKDHKWSLLTQASECFYLVIIAQGTMDGPGGQLHFRMSGPKSQHINVSC